MADCLVGPLIRQIPQEVAAFGLGGWNGVAAPSDSFRRRHKSKSSFQTTSKGRLQGSRHRRVPYNLAVSCRLPIYWKSCSKELRFDEHGPTLIAESPRSRALSYVVKEHRGCVLFRRPSAPVLCRGDVQPSNLWSGRVQQKRAHLGEIT
jgi:hypothetical protein